MSRIVNVIYKPHLATFKAYDDAENKCCVICDYKVIIETDDRRILIASVMDDCDLKGFDIDDTIKNLEDGNQCIFRPVQHRIDINELNDFLEGEIDEGSNKPIEAFRYVLDTIRESGCLCNDEVKKLLENVKL